MNYTKGEWKVDLEPQKYDYKNGYYIQGVEDAVSLAYIYPTDDDEETKSNTHLIAAAPDMYEALSKIMIWINTHPRKATIVRDVIDAGNAAIAKAEAK